MIGNKNITINASDKAFNNYLLNYNKNNIILPVIPDKPTEDIPEKLNISMNTECIYNIEYNNISDISGEISVYVIKGNANITKFSDLIDSNIISDINKVLLCGYTDKSVVNCSIPEDYNLTILVNDEYHNILLKDYYDIPNTACVKVTITVPTKEIFAYWLEFVGVVDGLWRWSFNNEFIQKDYLCITSLNDATKLMLIGNNTGDFEISSDTYNWYRFNKTDDISINNIINIPVNTKIYLRGYNKNGLNTQSAYNTISINSGSAEISGNIMTLINYVDIPNSIPSEYCFTKLFSNSSGITTVKNILPNNTTNYCYKGMFSSCISLNKATELPATILSTGCYSDMFSSCISLTDAPTLPALELVSKCYNNMFSNCTALNYVKALFTTTPSDNYTKNWLYNVAETGTFVKNNSSSWNVVGNNGIPQGWVSNNISNFINLYYIE